MSFLDRADKIILFDGYLRLSDNGNIEKQNIPHPKDYNHISVVIIDYGGYQNGFMDEIINDSSRDNIHPIVISIYIERDIKILHL